MAKTSFIHPFAFITRFASGVMSGTVPGSIDEHAYVCLTAWISFDRHELRTARGIRANPNNIVVSRFVRAPHFDGIKLQHVSLRSGYASGEEIPGAAPQRKNPRRARAPRVPLGMSAIVVCESGYRPGAR